jgi:hypothetical protein
MNVAPAKTNKKATNIDIIALGIGHLTGKKIESRRYTLASIWPWRMIN